jgi:disulfide bond formation protein DsbB
MLVNLTQRRALTIVFLVTLVTIIGAWLFQYAGYDPCYLCLLQRWAYYAAIPISLGLLLFAGRNSSLLKNGLYLLSVIMLASAIFGLYHAGIEWKWWLGPSTCTTGAMSLGLPDLTKPVVMCDEAALRILGLSLAGWNAVISIVLSAIAFRSARNHGSSSVSQ